MRRPSRRRSDAGPAPDARPAWVVLHGERGSAAAELAVALPAVVLVVLLGVGALGGAARQVALQDAAADAARLLGRGEDASVAAAAVARAVPGARMSSGVAAETVCVTARSEVAIGRLLSMPLEATSCALDGGL
ncbi:TadE family type IV pilus minor pilin [Microbacterium sp. 179-I 3D4 NHS]|uniref:TadE family type IV pilus minor pilin n=1 Tax=Microbacterium sp. 179-I 3D4 NHS TaxID=3142381 RepID=UPI0039A0811C